MYVAFIDLLGFTSAVESLDEEEVTSFSNLVSEAKSIYQPPLSIHMAGPRVKSLFRLYTEFQISCEMAIHMLSKYDAYTQHCYNRKYEDITSLDSILTPSRHISIEFSDSLFLASTAIEPIVDATGRMITNLLSKGIPARGGLAKGQFHTFEWNLRAGNNASFRANAPFLGAGVIRAYRAESKGPRGIRVIVHESCRGDIQTMDNWAVVELDSSELSAEWTTELNLALCTHPAIGGTLPIRAAYLTELAQRLHDKANPDIRARHYVPTLTALSRMRSPLVPETERTGLRLYDWRDEE